MPSELGTYTPLLVVDDGGTPPDFQKKSRPKAMLTSDDLDRLMMKKQR
jgi:hypothetical protein